MTTPLLAASGLVRRYGERVVVDRLSLSLRVGECFAVLGENGAGKTTTFEILSGLRRPDAGTIAWRGVEVSPTDAAYRAHLGVVFQKPALDDKLTARENLTLGAALYGVTGARARAATTTALTVAELTDRAGDKVGTFSGGMKRRLELARVLMHAPTLLVLDEPTSGLDPGFVERYWTHLDAERKQRGLTVLVTTHSAADAARANRLLLLDAGRELATGTAAELTARVGGDVVTLEADRPDELVAAIAAAHHVTPTVDGERLTFTAPRAHELVPRLVEALPRGRLKSVSVRPPGLGDVFLGLTGRAPRGLA